jgi:hypothetical protein
MKRNRPKNFLVGNVLDSLDRRSKGTILRSMAIFTAIELYGSILNGKTGRGNTKKNFLTFCKSRYMPTAYHNIAELLYGIFRNGIAHSYVPKGEALLSSNYYDKSKHLKFYSNSLFIYVPQLAKDLPSSIHMFYQDIKINATLQNNYNNVIQQLDTDGSTQYRNYLSQAGISPISRKIKRDIITALV